MGHQAPAIGARPRADSRGSPPLQARLAVDADEPEAVVPESFTSTLVPGWHCMDDAYPVPATAVVNMAFNAGDEI